MTTVSGTAPSASSTTSPDLQEQPADSGSFHLIVTIRPRHDRVAEAAAQLNKMRQASLAEPGCVSMTLLQEIGDETDTWVMVEEFASRAAWDEHMASEHNRSGNAVLEPMLREPSTLQLLSRRPEPTA